MPNFLSLGQKVLRVGVEPTDHGIMGARVIKEPEGDDVFVLVFVIWDDFYVGSGVVEVVGHSVESGVVRERRVEVVCVGPKPLLAHQS